MESDICVCVHVCVAETLAGRKESSVEQQFKMNPTF